MKRLLWLAPIAILCGPLSAFAADNFPLRPRYPDAPIIETKELEKRINEVTVVDVRSDYEYETLRIKDAVNIPLGDKQFAQKAKQLREKTGKPIVFYCNGVTCHKSYDAVLLAIRSRLTDVYVYDAGVFAWAKAHPELTALLGKSPINPANLIEEDLFKARLLLPKDFTQKIGGQAIVLDVRDKIQRDSPLFPFNEQRAQLDERTRIDAIIDQAKKERKTLLIYDEVGKQVQWLQYQLEGKGLKDYYFMKGGAQAYWNHRLGKVNLGKDDGAKASQKK